MPTRSLFNKKIKMKKTKTQPTEEITEVGKL